MKSVRFLCSVSGVEYQFGKGAEAELEDVYADSEVRVGNAEYIDKKNIPEGLQKPKRRPVVKNPEVHTTIISNDGLTSVKKRSTRKNPTKK